MNKPERDRAYPCHATHWTRYIYGSDSPPPPRQLSDQSGERANLGRMLREARERGEPRQSAIDAYIAANQARRARNSRKIG